MKPVIALFTVLLSALFSLSFIAPSESENSDLTENNTFNLSDFEVRDRLKQLDGIVDLKYNSHVEKNIRLYLGRRKRTLANIIGKSEMYFPMFEHYLQVNQLPDELKYLSIVESALNAQAKSHVGASGLWQFMKPTGNLYGLKVDAYIDERNDPIKATEASFNYLKDLYDRYDDWTLALAAYNCGPGNVNKAIRRSGSNDFWEMSRFLPAETRNYVPAFIATTYVMNYYQSHGIQPTSAEYKFQNLKTTTLFEGSSFYEISKIGEVNVQEVKKLNPAYKRNYIPYAKYGNYLTLPTEAMRIYKDKKRQSLLKKFYQSKYPDYNQYMDIPKDMIRSSYVVQKGESFEYIAKLLRCSTRDLMAWNKLRAPSTFYGQELIVHFPKEKPKEQLPIVIQEKEKVEVAIQPEIINNRILYHYIQQGETLSEISSYYPDVTLSELIQLNNFFGEIKLEHGEKLKIKEL